MHGGVGMIEDIEIGLILNGESAWQAIVVLNLLDERLTALVIINSWSKAKS